MQGRARRLFPDGHEAPLRLLEHKAFENGVVLTVYGVAWSTHSTGWSTSGS